MFPSPKFTPFRLLEFLLKLKTSFSGGEPCILRELADNVKKRKSITILKIDVA